MLITSSVYFVNNNYFKVRKKNVQYVHLKLSNIYLMNIIIIVLQQVFYCKNNKCSENNKKNFH